MVVFLLSGCSLTTGDLQLAHSRLILESETLKELRTKLSAPGFPPGSRHLEVTVSYAAINQILAGAQNLSYPLPKPQGAVLHFDKLQVIPADGTPMLSVQAYVTQGTVRLDLDVLAILFYDDQSGQAPIFRVRIKDLKPFLTWNVVRHLLLAHSIATYEADKLAINELAFTVPIEQALALNLPQSEVVQRILTPRGNGSWVDYKISRTKGIALKRTVRLDAVLFLRDGVHFFASVT
jgi:hypothetical protein